MLWYDAFRCSQAAEVGEVSTAGFDSFVARRRTVLRKKDMSHTAVILSYQFYDIIE
jgi:hypothetical protein